MEDTTIHFTEYNIYCPKCDRAIKYKVLGRTIAIDPCPCQGRNADLKQALAAIICLAEDNRLDSDDISLDSILQEQAHYQDTCFDTVYNFIKTLS